jgi:hypothetical protein
MIKINSSYKYPIFFFALIALIFFSEISNSQDAREPACAATIVITADESLCETQPTTQKITIYKVAFCTALPTVPTSTTATGMTSCSTVFQNTAGAIVTIQKGIGTTPDGTFTAPPYGNYEYAYVELSPVLTYKASLVFTTAKALSSTTGLGATTGFTTCWTNGTTNQYWDFLKGITCGNGVPNPTDTTNTMNSLDNGAALYGGTLTEGTNSGTTHIYLIQSNGTLASGSSEGVNGNVAKLIFFMPMNTNITPDTTSYNLLYNNSRGMVVWLNNNGPIDGGKTTVNGFFNIGFNAAYFDMTFQIQ